MLKAGNHKTDPEKKGRRGFLGNKEEEKQKKKKKVNIHLVFFPSTCRSSFSKERKEEKRSSKLQIRSSATIIELI